MAFPDKVQQLDERIAAAVREALEGLRAELKDSLQQSTESIQKRLEGLEGALPSSFLGDDDLRPMFEEVSRSARQDAFSELRDGLATLDGASSQGEVLTALLEQAGRFASRTALFLTRRDAAVGWGSYGFTDTEQTVSQLSFDYAEGSPWERLRKSGGTVVLSAADCATLASQLGSALAEGGVLVPLLLRDRLAAAVYADRLRQGDVLDVTALQILTYAAAQGLESLPFRQRPRTATLYQEGEAAGEAGILAPWEEGAAPPAEPAPAPPAMPEAVEPPVAEPTAEVAAPEPPAEPPIPTEPVEAAPAAETPAAVEPTLPEATPEDWVGVSGFTTEEEAPAQTIGEEPAAAAEPAASAPPWRAELEEPAPAAEPTLTEPPLAEPKTTEEAPPWQVEPTVEEPAPPAEPTAAEAALGAEEPGGIEVQAGPMPARPEEGPEGKVIPKPAAPEPAAPEPAAPEPPPSELPPREPAPPEPAPFDAGALEPSPLPAAPPEPSPLPAASEAAEEGAAEPSWATGDLGAMPALEEEPAATTRVPEPTWDREPQGVDEGEEGRRAGFEAPEPSWELPPEPTPEPTPEAAPTPSWEAAPEPVFEAAAEEVPVEPVAQQEEAFEPPPAAGETARPELDVSEDETVLLQRSAPPAEPSREPAAEPPTPPAPPAPEPPPPAAPAEPAAAPGVAALDAAQPSDDSTPEVRPPSGFEGPGLAFAGDQPQAKGDQAVHEEGRRLARLLVSEIRLYNEEEVEEGRRNRDIYSQLREEIDRSRKMYDERVDESLRGGPDYFREELVRILAGGDEDALGM